MTPQEAAAYEAGRRAKRAGASIHDAPHTNQLAWMNGWRAMEWQMQNEVIAAHNEAAQDRNDAELRRREC